ncbi:MAG TPA: hypothetical protein VFS54_04230 [Solirubrobacterales bacterium]|nr:hypothetical protein [Solirubrobacterales bacterium]
MTLVFGFPVGWAILTAVGAALLGSTGAATALDQYRARRPLASGHVPVSTSQSEVRKASGWILEDLEKARIAFEDALNNGFWWRLKPTPGAMFSWSEEGEALAIHGYQQEHRSIRVAVRHIDHCEVKCKEAWGPYKGSDAPKIDDPECIEEAIRAAREAEAGLERLLGPG